MLKAAIMERIKTGLTLNTGELYLNRIRTRNEPELIALFIEFVADNYTQLPKYDFPFHKLGKKMLLAVLKLLLPPAMWFNTGNHIQKEGPIKIGNPSEHKSYSLYHEGRFHDYKLQYDGQQYPVHKFILVSESRYFQRQLSDPMNKTMVYVVNPKHLISRKAFEAFLLMLYTNTITAEDNDRYYLHLLHLSIQFEVEEVKDLCLKRIMFELQTTEGYMKGFLTDVRTWNYLELKLLCAEYISRNHQALLKNEFPFHSMGKIMLLETFDNFLKSPDKIYDAPSSKAFHEEEDEEIEDF
jgi:hypothetical protein